MRYSLILVAAAALFTTVNPSSAVGQRHEIPQLNSCIEEFYDPEMYNYLTYRNHCTESLTVVFVAKDGSGASGSMDLRAGAKDSVGKLAGKVPEVGGFELYVCRLGCMPMAENGKVVDKPQSNFKCEPKSK